MLQALKECFTKHVLPPDVYKNTVSKMLTNYILSLRQYSQQTNKDVSKLSAVEKIAPSTKKTATSFIAHNKNIINYVEFSIKKRSFITQPPFDP